MARSFAKHCRTGGFLLALLIAGACVVWMSLAEAPKAKGFESTSNDSKQSGQDSTIEKKSVDFNADVRPIFNQHCISCHGGVKQASGLSFIRRASVLAEAESGEVPVKPGDPDHSELVRRILADEDERMPPADHGRPLSQKEINILKRWIAEGAQWEEHWAYVKPVRPEVPQIEGGKQTVAANPNSDATRLPPSPFRLEKPLDAFVAAKLRDVGLPMSPEADRRTWLRRVSFDLTGLPPTPEELTAFLADQSPDAYEKVVDRLLASPAYGERWAAMWLDLSRYADTVGFERDPHRNIWPYRDWLIRALNDDMPFDEFTIKQLAGDLLENPSLDDLIATAFHRNTQTNTEGGTDDEEFRIQAVIDRINTTWQVWQGTTFGCTQCHAHPYAPFEHDEYYKVMAFFNNSRDSDVTEEFPLLNVPLEENARQKARELDLRMSELRQSLFAQFSTINRDANWSNLSVDSATINQQGTAKLRIESANGETEVLSEGTIANNPTYTIESPIPAGSESFTALRIDVLPTDPEAALRTPEAGFVLSHLRAFVISPGQEKPHEIQFAAVFADEAEPIIDPERSLNGKDKFGWSQYTRLWRPTTGVFLSSKAIELKPGDRLQFALRQGVATDGSLAMLLRRMKFYISGDEAWTKLIDEEQYKKERAELAEVRKQRRAIKSVSIPIMQELPAAIARRTYQFVRGNWLEKSTEVSPDTPALMGELPADTSHDRLAFARWIASRDNPLTARVMVNRLWTELFGTGIVETAEDFGSSGMPPSNQPLLDYLAVQFQDDFNWSVKRLLREIVLSATYRQSPKASPELWARDPKNLLLARGPRNRLTAEMVRDQALSVSGLLSRKMYGPPVMPPQPAGVWRSVYNGEQWKNAEGEDRYRRGVYTYWKRTSGYPSFMAFDTPSREVCTARRIVTNTPLQALAALNDEAHIEFAQALGKRMQKEAGPEIESEIAWAYALVTNHEASPDTVADLAALYREAVAKYEQDPAKSAAMGGETPEQSARTVVANAILNLDRSLTK